MAARAGSSHIERRLSVSDSLATAVLGADYATPRKPRPAKRPQRGVAPANAPRRNGPPPKDSDDVVLEVRRLSEQCGMTPGAIAIHLGDLGFPIDRERARKITEYTTRSHLIPAADAPPYLERKNP